VLVLGSFTLVKRTNYVRVFSRRKWGWKVAGIVTYLYLASATGKETLFFVAWTQPNSVWCWLLAGCFGFYDSTKMTVYIVVLLICQTYKSVAVSFLRDSIKTKKKRSVYSHANSRLKYVSPSWRALKIISMCACKGLANRTDQNIYIFSIIILLFFVCISCTNKGKNIFDAKVIHLWMTLVIHKCHSLYVMVNFKIYQLSLFFSFLFYPFVFSYIWRYVIWMAC